MYIVIPMAGESSRFYNAGYTVPKYMLPLGNETLFDKSVRSFEQYFDNAYFIFILRSDDIDGYDFVNDHANMLGIKFFNIVVLNKHTRGQAETVMTALFDSRYNYYSSYGKFDTLVIFNIDTIRHNLSIPDGNYSSYFDAFYDPSADESKWSFCKVCEDYAKQDESVTYCISETAEKKKISYWCSTGLYIFGTTLQFVRAYEKMIDTNSENYDYYIAPLYNMLISDPNTKSSNYLLQCPREDVEFAGVPEDYEKLKIKYELTEEK